MNVKLIIAQPEEIREIIREEISSILKSQNSSRTSPTWMDNNATSKFLGISKRLLADYRNQGVLPFSQIKGKIYYKVSDIEIHLEKHYHKAFKNQNK